MKIWDAYGSEHSSSIVLRGSFKQITDKKQFLKDFGLIANEVAKEEDVYDLGPESFPETIHDLIVKGTIRGGSVLAPSDLIGFSYEAPQEDGTLGVTIKSNEYDWNGVIKLLIINGAKVEVFSEHDYPEEENS